MRFINFFIIFFLILLNSCGFKRLNLNTSDSFNIVNLDFEGDHRLTTILSNNLSIYSDQNSTRQYDIRIVLKTSKNIKIRDKTGKVTRYSSDWIADLEVKDKNSNKSRKKSFIASNNYEVSDNHSDTLRNEKNANDNNLNFITNEIIKFIRLINYN